MTTTLERIKAGLAASTRPWRRRLLPRHFKETYVNDVLLRRQESIYVEIGVRDGESFRLADASRRLGIDPEPAASFYPTRANEQLFEMTSDAFFADHAAGVLDLRTIDVALIDGLHTFEQVVRDFENLEPFMRTDGLIVLDDMNPQSAKRASERPYGGPWNGDVWKIGLYLQDMWPSLEFVTVDADEGVGLLGGFGSACRVPFEPDLAPYKHLPYEVLKSDRRAVLNLVKPRHSGRLIQSTRAGGGAE